MNIESIAAYSAVIGVLVAIFALIRQSQDTHLSLCVQLLRDLEKQFDDERMRKSRITLSKLLIERGNGVIVPLNTFVSNADVIDFFTTVGTLLKSRILDFKLTRNAFSYCAIRYWEASKKYIDEFRKFQHDEDCWSEYEYAYNRLVKYEARRLKIRPSKLDSTELHSFLVEESQLCQ